jgi:hypothetical protein
MVGSVVCNINKTILGYNLGYFSRTHLVTLNSQSMQVACNANKHVAIWRNSNLRPSVGQLYAVTATEARIFIDLQYVALLNYFKNQNLRKSKIKKINIYSILFR